MKLVNESRFYEITSGLKDIKPVLVLGDVGIDKYTFGEVNRISPEAPVPVLEVTKEWLKLGLAANISDNCDSLGVKSTLAGVIGSDLNGDIFLNLLKEKYLSGEALVRVTNRPTIFKERVTTKTQQICRIDYESTQSIDAVAEQQLIDNIKSRASSHGALIIEDYGKGTLTERVISEVIKVFNKEKRLVTVDPSRTTNPRFYTGANLLKPNLAEAKMLSQSMGLKSTDVKEIAKFLSHELQINMVVVTLGGEGMALYDRTLSNEVEIIPTVANEVFDVSGAGDTAITAITSALLFGATLEEAAWVGNCASGVVVGKKGTATVDIEELKDFYGRLQRRVGKGK